MKKLIVFCFLLTLNGYLFSQTKTCDLATMGSNNYVPNLRLSEKGTLRGDDVPEKSCWKVGGKVIGISFVGVKGFKSLNQQSDVNGHAKLSMGEKVGRSDQTSSDFEPLNYGYNVAKMDPLDPGNTGAQGRTIFLQPTGPPTGSLDDKVNYEYYYFASGKANYPKSIISVGSQGVSTTKKEYIVNSQEEMTKAYRTELSANIGAGDSDSYGFEIGGGVNSGERFSSAKDAMIGLYVSKTINDNISRSNFSAFTKNFLNALEDVKTSLKFKDFFEKWGTHYAASVNLGSAKFKKETFTKNDIEKAIEKGYQLNAKGAASGVKASVKFSDDSSLNKKASRAITSNSMQAIGGTKSPVEVNLIPIYHLLEAIKDKEYSEVLYGKMKAAHEKYYKDIKEKNKDFNKPFISQKDMEDLENPAPRVDVEDLSVSDRYRLFPAVGNGEYTVFYMPTTNASITNHIGPFQKLQFKKIKNLMGKDVKSSANGKNIYQIRASDLSNADGTYDACLTQYVDDFGIFSGSPELDYMRDQIKTVQPSVYDNPLYIVEFSKYFNLGSTENLAANRYYVGECIDGFTNQQFTLEEDTNKYGEDHKYYKIRNERTKQYVNVASSKAEVGNYLHGEDKTPTKKAAQAFRLLKTN